MSDAWAGVPVLGQPMPRTAITGSAGRGQLSASVFAPVVFLSGSTGSNIVQRGDPIAGITLPQGAVGMLLSCKVTGTGGTLATMYLYADVASTVELANIVSPVAGAGVTQQVVVPANAGQVFWSIDKAGATTVTYRIAVCGWWRNPVGGER